MSDENSKRATEAMNRHAEGDEAAFGVVYEYVAPRLEVYLRRYLRDASRREAIILSTFLWMHRQRGTFILGTDVTRWAFSIARHLVVDTPGDGSVN